MTAKQVRDLGLYLLAIFISITVTVLMFKLFKVDIPANNRDAVMLGLGIILGCFKDVFGYFFGSSKGSADKSEQLATKPPVE